MGNSLILIGVLIVVAGIVITIFPGLKLPLLPGDILIRREGFTFYFTVVSSILISIILTVILGLFRK